jgi:3-hydroxybutyryl-CoA dehydrogenase
VDSAADIQTVAVVGGGLMGSGIAEAVAAAGMDVVLRDLDEPSVRRTHTRIEASLSRAVRGGKLTEAEAAEVSGRIALTTDLAEIAGAQFVIEAVPEDKQLKLGVIEAIAQVTSVQTVIASNTSSIPVTELAQAVEDPRRVLGLHFFSPVPVMQLVEIVVALDTSPETVATARGFATALGKTPIETKDRSGFVVNMLLVPYLMAAVRMFEDGFATRDDIDAGMKLGCGHPMGPLTLSDFIGLDVLHAIGVSLYDEFKRDEYAPPPLLKRMVASGRLGRKSGRGFYEYA